MNDPRFVFFNPVNVTRSSVVEHAVAYLGCPYTHGRSAVFLGYNGEVSSAKFSCLGFVLQVAKDVHLLPEEFGINGPRFDRDMGWEDTVQAILDNNFDTIPVNESGPGDIFKMRYTDIDKDAPIHVAIKLTWATCPNGEMIHAINYDIGGESPGSVTRNRIDINEYNRILSAHRIRGIID